MQVPVVAADVPVAPMHGAAAEAAADSALGGMGLEQTDTVPVVCTLSQPLYLQHPPQFIRQPVTCQCDLGPELG